MDAKDGISRTTPSMIESLEADQNEKHVPANQTQDIAEDLYREIESYTPEELAAEQIRVRKLIDWRIMPIVSVTLNSGVYLTIPDLSNIHDTIS